MSQHLTTNELAERWGISPRTLSNWRVRRKGPPHFNLVGARGQVRYRLEDVVKYEQQQLRQQSRKGAKR